ncbi:PAAR domain-containing protein [Acanthopleuribacter pedis]|uniref:PAAR domain-containing protein n=1 Tax=Acanthopleuribacter pedis TaxID=442870 RepID=A0A8J7QE60_9BACT|nr:PAAR domain-containing protein [Acanthopleuribacter pedis]MBO1322204.1 PAAR domain-containing protein [Acanthopleuribacter pedis]
MSAGSRMLSDIDPALPGVPPATPPSLKRPENALHKAGNAIATVVTAPAAAIGLLNEGFARATNFVASALPSQPAAFQTSLALGAPHAHIAHPPSGPAPIPPTPIPPVGPVTFGCCVQVLINGRPAARAGDMGVNPTCCGLPPMYEIYTGSSKVFIGGARAARVGDITFHCKPVPSEAAALRGAIATAQKAMRAAMMACMVGGFVATGLGVAGDIVESVEADNADMSAALALSAATATAQMANDVMALAAAAMMGKDPCLPPGTPGAIFAGSPDVWIGGFPMPPWMDIAKGLLKMVKGLRARNQNRSNTNGTTRVGAQH